MVKQGNIIWLDFNSQIGLPAHEQKDRRLALILSNETFNNFSKLSIVCPIINKDKNHPFHVRLNEKTKTKGVILCDQAKTLDIKARQYEYIENIPEEILIEVIDIIYGFIEKEKTEEENT